MMRKTILLLFFVIFAVEKPFVSFVFKKKADLVLSSVGNVPLVMRLF